MRTQIVFIGLLTAICIQRSVNAQTSVTSVCYVCFNDPVAYITNLTATIDLSQIISSFPSSSIASCQEIFNEGRNSFFYDFECQALVANDAFRTLCGCSGGKAPVAVPSEAPASPAVVPTALVTLPTTFVQESTGTSSNQVTVSCNVCFNSPNTILLNPTATFDLSKVGSYFPSPSIVVCQDIFNEALNYFFFQQECNSIMSSSEFIATCGCSLTAAKVTPMPTTKPTSTPTTKAPITNTPTTKQPTVAPSTATPTTSAPVTKNTKKQGMTSKEASRNPTPSPTYRPSHAPTKTPRSPSPSTPRPSRTPTVVIPPIVRSPIVIASAPTLEIALPLIELAGPVIRNQREPSSSLLQALDFVNSYGLQDEHEDFNESNNTTLSQGKANITSASDGSSVTRNVTKTWNGNKNTTTTAKQSGTNSTWSSTTRKGNTTDF